MTLTPENGRDLLAEYEQRAARNSKIAWWCLFPYAGGAVLCFLAFARIWNTDRTTSVMVGVGATVMMTFQWVQPYLFRRPLVNVVDKPATGPDGR